MLNYSWESLGLQGDPTSPSQRRSVLGVHWKDWRWSWNSNTLATSRKELTHLKRPWCWEGLGSGGEGDDRGWDGWMASPTRRTWVWVNSKGSWLTGRTGVTQIHGVAKGRTRLSDWTELNWMLNRQGKNLRCTIHWRSLQSGIPWWPCAPEPMRHDQSSHHNGKPTCQNEEGPARRS